VKKDGKSSTSQGDPARLFFPKPEISQMNGGNTTTKGGQTLQVTGSFFGPISSNILVTFGDLSFTNVVWKSDTLLELVTPPMTGGGSSKNLVVKVEAGNQFTSGPLTFSYTAPTVTRIDLLAQKVPSGAGGVRMVVHGTEFADVTPIADRIIIRGIKGDTTILCLNVTRVSYEELQCDYPQGGDGETAFNVQVEVAEQTADDVLLVYCSDVRMDTNKLNGVAADTAIVERGQDVSFTAQLSTPLAAISGAVTVRAVIDSGEEHCTLTAPTGDVQRSHGNYNTPFFVNVTTTESEERSPKSCVIKLTLESEDPCYNESAKTFEHELKITVTPKVCS